MVQFLGSSDNVNFVAIHTQPVNTVGWNTYILDPKPTYRYLRIAAGGASYSFASWIVRPFLLPPTAAFSESVVGDTVTFNASASADADGFIISYVWNFGDGEQGFGRNVVHTYPQTGVGYNVSLLVTDNHGNETIYTEEIGV
jgi:PKD repeat protein